MPHEIINSVPGYEDPRHEVQIGQPRSQDIIDHVPSQEELVGLGYGREPSLERQTIENDWAIEELAEAGHSLKSRTQDPSLVRGIDAILENGVDSNTGQKFWGAEWARNVEFGIVATRKLMAGLLVNDPEAYGAMRDGRIAGFHGTRSVALAGVLRTGQLSSARELSSEEAESPLVASGEHHTSHGSEGMRRVSFSSLDDLATPKEYAGGSRNESLSTENVLERAHQRIAGAEALRATSRYFSDEMSAATVAREQRVIDEITHRPDSLESTLLREDFPVMFGIDGAYVAQLEDEPAPAFVEARTFTGQSGQAEFRPLASSVPLEKLPVIAVPEDRLEQVRALFAQFNRDNKVIALESLEYPSRNNE